MIDSYIDSHVHFYDPSRPDGIVWPDVNSGLRGTALPADFEHAAAGVPVAGVIAVETSRRFVDDRWLIDLANREPLIRGAVLNLQPDTAGFEQRLASARSSEKFCGIRLRPIVNYDLSSPRLRDSFCSLSEAGHSIEFGAGTPPLKQSFAKLAADFENNYWILDHTGHPGTSDVSSNVEWLESMASISKRPNVFVKVTSPYDAASQMSACDILSGCQKLLKVLRQLFGAERLLFSGNWPVSTTSYGHSVQLFERCIDSSSDRKRFFEQNANLAYPNRTPAP